MKKFEEEIRENILEILVSNTGSSLYGQSYLNYDAVVELSEGWISPEDHQAEVGKIELQNLKYREEIARMQKSLRKKNKAIKELNGAVKKSKVRLKECEDLRIEANNSAAMEYSRKCEVVEERAKLTEEVYKLKSQLEKQPEIPECVAKLIEERGVPEDGEFRNYLVDGGEHDKAIDWINTHQRTWLLALLNCYTVAKEKRFYLKHIDMSKRDVDGYAWYLKKYTDGELDHKCIQCDEDIEDDNLKFTQQEIDSMETGSYEQIEVGDD